MRLADYTYNPLQISARRLAENRPQVLFEDENFVHDPETIWTPRKSYGVFNAQGFRGPELSRSKPAGEFRIFAVGDSNTLGWAGSRGANWPLLLGALLAQRSQRFVVVNAGVWGHSSFQGLGRLRQCLPLEPDLLLVSYGSNDAHPVPVTDREFAARHRRQRLANSLRLGQLFLAAWSTMSPPAPQGPPTRRVPLAEYRANLAEMVRVSRSRGIRLVFLTRPYVGEAPAGWWKNDGADYNAATVEVAAASGVPVIDIYTHFKDQGWLFEDESHFTGEGHHRAAAILSVELLPLCD